MTNMVSLVPSNKKLRWCYSIWFPLVSTCCSNDNYPLMPSEGASATEGGGGKDVAQLSPFEEQTKERRPCATSGKYRTNTHWKKWVILT